MSNVAKLKKKAAEFEAKKQFDKALPVYLQILNSAAPGDEEVEVALYNRVGDLMLRQGNTAEAVTYYEKAVDLYAEGGFFNNAIALCNKILRQSPGRSVVYYKLGKISAKKGFRSDAKQNFLEYADRMQQVGQIDEAFRALKEFADLVPDQEDVRLMLAEQLSKKDRRGEALEQLQILHAKYEHEGRAGEAKAALERMRTLDPAFEPKTSTAVRTEKPSDLIFLDVSWEAPRTGTPRSSGALPDSPPQRPGITPPEGLETLAPAAAHPPTDKRLAGLDIIEVDVDSEDDDEADALSAVSIADVEEVADRGGSDLDASLAAPLLGLQSTSFEVADLDPPLSGSAFGALTLDTPGHDDFEAPAHDLGLPGDLPDIGGDLELIMPPDDEPAEFESASAQSFGSSLDTSTPELDRGFDADAEAEDEDEDEDDANESGGSELTFLDTSANDLPFLDVGERSPFDSHPHDVEASELAFAAEVEAPLIEADAEEAEGSFQSIELLSSVDESLAELPEEAHDSPFDVANDDAFIMQEGSESFDSGASISDEMAAVVDDGAGSSAERFEVEPVDDDRFDAASLLAPHRPAVHAHAQAVAALRARIEGAPDDSSLRRRLAELLLDAGSREEGIAELERAMAGYERAGDIDQARSVVDDVLRMEPNSVAHHQKRVEYAFRSNDRARLGDAYLELADALFRTGQGDKARAVYERVLELSPENARARGALHIVMTPAASSLAVREEPTASAPTDAPQAPREPSVAPSQPRRDAPATPPTSPPIASAPPRPFVPAAIAPAPAVPASPAETAPPAPLATAPAAEPATPPKAPEPPIAPVRSAASKAVFGDDDSFVNLGDWLREGEATKSTRMVTDAKEPVEGEEFDFAEMLAKFKQGVAENVDEDDHESHYDLGVAFKEMGLVEEAISEFQKALRSTSRRTRTYEALGQCFLEQSQFQVASTVLQRALVEPGVGDEQLVGVLYLLGYAAEALGRKPAAVEYYERVFAVDIRFRDVTERLNALQQAETL